MREESDAYRLPAEWEPHRATWLTWPTNEETWPGIFDRMPAWYDRLIAALRRFEEVRVLVRDEAARQDLLRRFDTGQGFPVTPVIIPTNDAWIRDYGPLFVYDRRRSVVATLWRFNAWGEKYPPWDLDAAAGRAIATWTGHATKTVDRVLEGGSIDVNGRGTLLTTESCLLNPNRNPGMERRDIESELRARFGVSNTLWLCGAVAGDDTDGHVDVVTRFVDARTVVAVVEENRRDENHAPLQENFERLERMTDQDGRALRVVKLPMPEPLWHEGERLPASYANFLFVNAGMLVPTFESPRDEQALEVLRRVCPGRRIVGIDSRLLLLGLGGIHCMTMQEPLAVDKSI